MNNMTSIYQQLTDRIGDRAYSLARATHRHRDSTIECQIYAAVSDAIIQHRNDRHELALAIAEIVAAMPLTDRQAAATDRERDELFALFPEANLQQRFDRDETAQDRMDRPGESEEEISMRRNRDTRAGKPKEDTPVNTTLDTFGQRALIPYPNRVETYSDWNTGPQTLQAWKPFDSPLSAMTAFTDLCNRYQRGKLVGIYRLMIDNKPAATLETSEKRLTLHQPDTYNTLTLNGITTGPHPVIHEAR